MQQRHLGCCLCWTYETAPQDLVDTDAGNSAAAVVADTLALVSEQVIEEIVAD